MTLRLAAALVCVTGAVAASDLKLTLTSWSAEVPAGAPIVLRATLEATAPVKAVPEISAENGNFELWVANLNNGAVTRYLGPRWGHSGTLGAAKNLGAGESLKKELTLLFQPEIEDHPDTGARRLPFTAARYKISMQYLGLGPDHPLYASTVVSVREPAGEGEAAWWKTLQEDPALAKAIQTADFGSDSGRLKKVTELIEAHPKVPHTDAAAVAVGRYYLRVKKDAAKATSYLRLAGRNEADPGMRRRAMLETAEALEMIGAPAEAAQVRKQADELSESSK